MSIAYGYGEVSTSTQTPTSTTVLTTSPITNTDFKKETKTGNKNSEKMAIIISVLWGNNALELRENFDYSHTCLRCHVWGIPLFQFISNLTILLRY